jgi:hypothetical protein
VTIDNAVTAGSLQTTARFVYPSGLGPIIRIHATANNSVIGILQGGEVVSIDSHTGAVSSPLFFY